MKYKITNDSSPTVLRTAAGVLELEPYGSAEVEMTAAEAKAAKAWLGPGSVEKVAKQKKAKGNGASDAGES